MPYKRRARVVFAGPSAWVARARRAAAVQGGDWVETGGLEDALSGWADLVVTLDARARARLPALPPTCRHKHWPVSGEEEIEARVAGMIGGLRLLSRLVEDD